MLNLSGGKEGMEWIIKISQKKFMRILVVSRT